MRANLTRTAGSVLLAAAVTVGFAPAALASVGPEDSPAASTATAAATAAAPAANAPRAAQSPSQVLESTPWQTTGAVDQDGKKVALDHPGVANYVGWAYYKADGTFTMYNLDDSPKMHGEWSVDAEGKTRTLVAKNDAGEVLFTRVVPLVELTASTFTYRVFPDAADQSTYFDIIHTPTNHAEPGSEQEPEEPAQSPSQVLESTPWQTTGAVDQDGKKVALDHLGVANYVGWAYYKADGTFTMYNLDDSPKMHGEWSVDAEGKTRTLVAKNDAGEVLFTRVVPLVELTASTFTYRVFPDAADESTYFDIIHTPTKHAEPSAPEKPVDPETPGTDEPGTETPENPEQPGTDEPGAETPGAESPEQPGTDAPQDQDRAPVDEVPADTIPAADAPTAGDVADDNTANEADAAEDAAVEQGELARTGAEGPVAITAAALFALMGGAGAFVAARRRSAA